MANYINRIIDGIIKESLREAGCVVIEGPKWCGKSTSAKRFAKTIVELQNPSIFKQYKLYADVGDSTLLKGEIPVMFDEWQKIPDLWDYIRAEVDTRGGKGHFILTGSAKPLEDEKRHSGIGRMKKVVMRPMTMFESGDSTGQVSIKGLFENSSQTISGRPKYDLADIAWLLCRGGWPEAVTEPDKKLALKLAINYVNDLVSADIVSVDGIKRNTSRARQILRAYARLISTPAPLSTIAKDIKLEDGKCDSRTLDSYINAYKKLYVIEDIEAWSPKLRSKTAIRSSATRQFIDPSIAAAALGANPQDLINDLSTFGLLFESLALRDLRVYAEKNEGRVYNYHDALGLEADAIIHLNNGKWGAVEVKLGGEEAINTAAKNLLKLKERVDESESAPCFLLVLTAVGFSHRRPDGVFVVPISALKD